MLNDVLDTPSGNVPSCSAVDDFRHLSSSALATSDSKFATPAEIRR